MEKPLSIRWRLFKALFTRNPLATAGGVVWSALYDRDPRPALAHQEPIEPGPAVHPRRYRSTAIIAGPTEYGMDYRDAIAWWLFTAGETGFDTMTPTGIQLPEGTPGLNDDSDSRTNSPT